MAGTRRPLPRWSQQVAQRRDLPRRHRTDAPRFAVVGYGKLGGKELGYASDLDIIFLFDEPDEQAGEVYARLAQRLNTWLSSRTFCVRSEPRITGLVSRPVMSAPTASGPDMSITSLPVSRHNVSAGPE